MTNVSEIILHNGPFVSKRGIQFPREGCCSFLRNTEGKNATGRIHKRHLPPNVKDYLYKYQRLCRLAGFPWKVVHETKKCFYVTIKRKDMRNGHHMLATWSTVRYLFSPYYHGIPERAVQIHKKYKVSNMYALVLGHYNEPRYNSYYGLLGSDKTYYKNVTKKGVFDNMNLAIHYGFHPFRCEIPLTKQNLKNIPKTFKLRKR